MIKLTYLGNNCFKEDPDAKFDDNDNGDADVNVDEVRFDGNDSFRTFIIDFDTGIRRI